MKYLLMIVLLFSFNQVRAVEGFYKGNDLLEECEAYLSDTGSAAKGNICIGYIMGVVDTHAVVVIWDGSEKRFCLPRSIQSSQLVRVAIKYLKENPQDLHLAATGLVIVALDFAFPCE